MKKYIACLTDADEVLFFGDGDTPEAAFADFLNSGELDAALDYGFYSGPVDVLIYTWLPPHKSDYPPEEINHDWIFVLDEKVNTITYYQGAPNA